MLIDLVSDLRVYLYDIIEPYKYTDELLLQCLVSAVRLLGRRWNHRYFLVEGEISRNPEVRFKFPEPPVIMSGDDAVIIVQAAIILRSAATYDATWDVASWRDDEIAYSNIQGARSRDEALRRDLDLLETLLKARLVGGIVQPLPGFHAPFNTVEGAL